MAQASQSQPAEVPTREQIQQVQLNQSHLSTTTPPQHHNSTSAVAACRHGNVSLLSLVKEHMQELEDNEKLIKAILENMNAGKLQACAG